jgi:HTH-type transcriptional regulator/antitoxin HigA
MDIPPIRTKDEFMRLVEEIGSLMDAQPGTPEGDRLDALATRVEAYEDEHEPPGLWNDPDVRP